jgi:hypothetical protein
MIYNARDWNSAVISSDQKIPKSPLRAAIVARQPTLPSNPAFKSHARPSLGALLDEYDASRLKGVTDHLEASRPGGHLVVFKSPNGPLVAARSDQL